MDIYTDSSGIQAMGCDGQSTSPVSNTSGKSAVKGPSGIDMLRRDLNSGANGPFFGMINFDLAEKEGVYGTVRAHTLPNFADLL